MVNITESFAILVAVRTAFPPMEQDETERSFLMTQEALASVIRWKVEDHEEQEKTNTWTYSHVEVCISGRRDAKCSSLFRYKRLLAADTFIRRVKTTSCPKRGKNSEEEEYHFCEFPHGVKWFVFCLFLSSGEGEIEVVFVPVLAAHESESTG